MRWKQKPLSENGEYRIKVMFALFPVSAGLEYRWFEKVAIVQQCVKRYAPFRYYWISLRFMDEIITTQTRYGVHKHSIYNEKSPS